MKLEPNMYVRTKDGYINKIKIVNQYNVLVDGIDLFGEELNIPNNEILKASHNIIDLIEVGDVIVDKEGHKYSINYEFETDYNSEYSSYEITIDDYITLFLKDGLAIVTKEQFSSMEYRLGDKE